MYEFEIGDDYEENGDSKQSFLSKIPFLENLDKKKILIITGIIITIVVLIVIISNLGKANAKYERLEKELVNAAKRYINDNNITVNREIFLGVKKLNVELDSECLLISGVIYDGKTFTPYLSCKNYESEIYKSSNESLELKGKTVEVILKGLEYFEQGYRSEEKVEIVGEVGSEEGIYNIIYTPLSGASLMRKVIIFEDDDIYKLIPKIELKGNPIEYLELNGKYKDAGVNVFDINEDLEDKLEIEENINNKEEGEYSVIYSVVNSLGYQRVVVRKVYVTSNIEKKIIHSLVPSTKTGLNVTIILSITSTNFDYVELPNGDKINDKYVTYEVSENGNYIFIVHEKDGSEYRENVEVNNIEKENISGSCKATWKSDYTEINVSVENNIKVSSYEYILNNKTEVESISKTYKSNVIKPETVKVKVKDSFGSTSEINCEIEDKMVPEIITDARDKRCLEGYVCYVQYDYASSKYPYCSVNGNPAACNGIGRNGCSITSASIAIANLGVKSSKGEVYNPFTVWEELYPIADRSAGICWGGCSAWTRIRDSIINAGLSAPKNIGYIKRENIPEIIAHLKKGYPIIVFASKDTAYTKGGHYMTLLAVREEDNYVFLSDPALPTNGNNIKKNFYNGKQYYADTWIPTDDLITGGMNSYLLVGPPGYF